PLRDQEGEPCFEVVSSDVHRGVPQMLVVLGEPVVAEDQKPAGPPAAPACGIEGAGEPNDLESGVAHPRPHRLPSHRTPLRPRSMTSWSGLADPRTSRAWSSTFA